MSQLFTLMLTIWILFLVEKDGVFPTIFKEMNARLAFAYCSLSGVWLLYIYSQVSSLLFALIGWSSSA